VTGKRAVALREVCARLDDSSARESSVNEAVSHRGEKVGVTSGTGSPITREKGGQKRSLKNRNVWLHKHQRKNMGSSSWPQRVLRVGI